MKNTQGAEFCIKLMYPNTLYWNNTMTQEIVKFNVGGVHYDTTITTLKNVPNNMLLTMVEFPGEKKDRIFIDRNGHLFSHVLDYLRDPEIWTCPLDPSIRVSLSREASFYCLLEMKKILQVEINPLHEKYPVVTIIAEARKIVVIRENFPLKLVLENTSNIHDFSALYMQMNINIMEKAGYRLVATPNHPDIKDYKQIHYIFSANP